MNDYTGRKSDHTCQFKENEFSQDFGTGTFNWITQIDGTESTWILTHLASDHPLRGLHILPSPIIPNARCDKGAKSPLAPTVPFSGTHGRHDSGIENTCSLVLFNL